MTPLPVVAKATMITADEEVPDYRGQLMPCPFCGSRDVDPKGWLGGDGGEGPTTHGPACDDCGASAENVERWNTRPGMVKLDDVQNIIKGLNDNILVLGDKRDWAEYAGDVRRCTQDAITFLEKQYGLACKDKGCPLYGMAHTHTPKP